ncbi:S1C family serine protease [Miltoncostaea marina]|uniref:S1C family serine protease n=1 Tax=Miltoncostaea marina TaxID=2843215 RepID=UPI001C3E043D|nr:trypsin-like peptidase domain-containing protein [Miltoncostaea marina]
MTGPLPPLEPRGRGDGLPALAPRAPAAPGLPALPPAPPRADGVLPPLGGPAGHTPPPPPPPRRRRAGPGARLAALVAATALVAGLVGGVAAGLLDDDGAPAHPGGAGTATPVTRSPVTPPFRPGSGGELAEAVARVSPTVVQVRSDAGSQGSGVIVAPSGRIITNEHVVRGASQVTVLTADERRVPATVLRADARQDLAVLRADIPVGRGAELSPSTDGLRQGEQVFAIGSPFGLQDTVTAGVVSNVGRTNREGVPMIQIDAPINPGNSGGGLFDLDGRLVGIPTSIVGPIPGNVGIGFAVPVSRVQAMLDGAP